ncbi:MAG: alcohol dehydrogenase catalytic domain-containing protein [Acholeplasmataceae bacterium]|nr:alcohol dehydrogenase catalytic domain-containing protein [Acholeplasmataceae bacterium]
MSELIFKATSVTKYADTEAINVVDRKISTTLKENQVLVKIMYAGLNKADLFLFKGIPKPIKLAYGLRVPKYQFVGSDISGEVVAIGKNVKQFKIGDYVFGDLPFKILEDMVNMLLLMRKLFIMHLKTPHFKKLQGCQ